MSRREKKPDVALDGVVDWLWPYDGPHTPETVAAAARTVSGLVRYLNNATRSRCALPHAASAHQVISELATAVQSMPQLLGQLQRFVEQQADDPTLYDDRWDRPGAQTATELAEQLRFACTDTRVLAVQLVNAAQCSVHLGNEDPAHPQDGGGR